MFQESTEAFKKAEWKFPKSSIARTQRTSHEYRWTYEERQIRWSQIYERKNKVKKYVNDTTIQRNLFNQKIDLHFCMQKRCYVPIVQYKPCAHLTNLQGVSLTLIYTSNEKSTDIDWSTDINSWFKFQNKPKPDLQSSLRTQQSLLQPWPANISLFR